MRVLWFTNTSSLGETLLGQTTTSGGWIKSLEHELADQVELSIAFYHGEDKAPFQLGGTTYYPIFPGNRNITGKLLQRINHSIESESDVEQFMTVIRKVQPDLIHIHGTEGPFGLIQSRTNIPVLISIQGLISVCEQKYFSGISRWQANRFTTLKSKLKLNSYTDQYKRFLKQAKREERILSLSGHLTGRTDWDRRVTSVLAPAAVYYPANEILRDIFYKRQWRPSANYNLRLFTITGSNLFKGFETVIHCAQLLDRMQLSYTWEIAGITETDTLVALAESALRIKKSPHIHLLGKLDEEPLSARMLQTDLYIGISHMENSPNSLCEALLMGIPSISTYAGGTASLITDNEDGLLVQDGDPYAMAGAIAELSRNPEKMLKFSENARSRALIRHDKTTIREAFLAIYRQITDRSKITTHN